MEYHLIMVTDRKLLKQFCFRVKPMPQIMKKRQGDAKLASTQ